MFGFITRLGAVVGVLALMLTLLGTGSAQAAPPDRPPKPAPEEVVYDTTVEAFKINPQTGELGDLIEKTKGPKQVVAFSSGTGGSSSASGCIGIRLTNSGYSAVFGSVLFRYRTLTSWCWNRTQGRVSSIGASWDIIDVSSQMYWRGEVNNALGFYTWRAGYGQSGYRHYRQGSFENCVLKYGCIGRWYPSNDIRVHSDGTYAYTVQGADT